MGAKLGALEDKLGAFGASFGALGVKLKAIEAKFGMWKLCWDI